MARKAVSREWKPQFRQTTFKARRGGGKRMGSADG